MKPSHRRLIIAVLVSLHFSVSAATYYVDAGGTNPVPPYADWTTAATNIQDAINVAGSGDTVLVTNGIYQYGGYSSNGSNRVYVTSGVVVQSVNGPAVTTIAGYQVPGTTNGDNAIRCVFLAGGSMLSGFTLTSGATQTSQNGGGVLMQSSCVVSNCIINGNAAANDGGGINSGNNSSVNNCLISGNVAGNSGGGAYECVLNNCVVSSNNAEYGGGVGNCTVNDSLLTGNGNTNNTSGGAAYLGTLNNCTITGNFEHDFGATDGCTVNNCIIYYNNEFLASWSDCYGTRMTNSCALSFETAGSPVNCITNPPLFANPAGDFHLLPWSPCIDTGTNVFAPSGTDLDGIPRIVGAAVDMGCYENQNTNAVHYVSLSNAVPVSPFTNWLTAATNIQDAVDAASAGDFVVVSNGVYNYGASYVYLTMPNRVAVKQPMTVESLNGPGATSIAGVSALGIRCVYLTNGAVLSGFTLTNGSTMTSGDPIHEESGGGVWCEGSDAIVTNCIFVANNAPQFGGGAFQGTLLNCTFTNNQSSAGAGACSNIAINCIFTHNKAFLQGPNYGGGAYGCWLSNCLMVANVSLGSGACGGGAAFSTLTSCVVSNNGAGNSGGGVYLSIVNNSLISSNRAVGFGGGAYSNILSDCVLKNNLAANGGGASLSTLNNCTIVSNNATSVGGGVDSGTLNNCIVYHNNSPKIPDYPNDSRSIMNFCDAISELATNGIGNITNDPAFVNLAGEDFHLQSDSPCINSGNNSAVMSSTDFDSNPRVAGGTVDIGTYEFQSPASILSYAWAQQYGLPTDGSVDGEDLDGTGFTVYQDWIAGLNPTNPASVLAMMPPAPTNNASGITVTWQSVSNIIYFVQSATNLSAQPAFSSIQSNVVGQVGTTSYTDTTATNSGPYFYRVGVQ